MRKENSVRVKECVVWPTEKQIEFAEFEIRNGSEAAILFLGEVPPYVERYAYIAIPEQTYLDIKIRRLEVNIL